MRVVLTLAFLALAEPLAAQIYAIDAGAVIDPARGTADRDQTLLVTDGRITSIGPRRAAPAGASAYVQIGDAKVASKDGRGLSGPPCARERARL